MLGTLLEIIFDLPKKILGRLNFLKYFWDQVLALYDLTVTILTMEMEKPGGFHTRKQFCLNYLVICFGIAPVFTIFTVLILSLRNDLHIPNVIFGKIDAHKVFLKIFKNFNRVLVMSNQFSMFLHYHLVNM